jgi:hypothetical protein
MGDAFFKEMNDDIFIKLRKAYFREDDKVPAGYKSAQELQSLWKLSETHSKRIIRKGILDGKLERINVMINSKVIPHYGPKKKR